MIENVGHQALDHYRKEIYRKDLDVGAIEIHKAIGKCPRPKAGFTPGKYKYMGPYNPP